MPQATQQVSEREQHALDMIEKVRARAPRFRDKQITMAHGAGGKATQSLVEGMFLPAFDSQALAQLDDSGTVMINGTGLAVSTDSFVVNPIVFPGGSIGSLAVHGTVNDLAMAGARARALTVGMVLEEGLATETLQGQVDALAQAAELAGVDIVAGDTKVVERGLADSMYITTTGIGVIDERAQLSPASLRASDRVIVSGSIARHGVAIMLARGEFELTATVESDTRALWPAVDALLEAVGPSVRCMRDATRGGVATVLNELARASSVAVLVEERDVPLMQVVAGACEILGIDPMYVANEGTFVAIVAPEAVDEALAALRSIEGCEEAADIGEVRGDPPGRVLVETGFGGRRIMDMLVGDPLPRIC